MHFDRKVLSMSSGRTVETSTLSSLYSISSAIEVMVNELTSLQSEECIVLTIYIRRKNRKFQSGLIFTYPQAEAMT